jgi:hypothetical protein
LLAQLIPIDPEDAHLIIPKLGSKNAIELLDGFGMRKLDEINANKLSTLLDRVRKLNSKRNILVHGHWVLEANVILRRGEAALATQFLREITPNDPKDAKAMANPRNQKERVRYSFTIKRIEGAIRDTNTLRQDISDFLGALSQREPPLSEVVQQLIRNKPYRVTYPT